MPEIRLTLRERAEARLAALAMRLPRRLQLRLAGGEPIVHDGAPLHPEIQLLLRLRDLVRTPKLSSLEPAVGRRHRQREAIVHAGRPIRVGSVRDLSIGGAAGPLRARHYAPPADGAGAPLLVFLHGGGFVIGDLETHDPACRILCRDGRLHVLSVDYRLAPEHPFPAAVEDARAAFEWALHHASDFGADPSRVAIGGDSAGGNLAAVVCQLQVEQGRPAPAAQLLLYPPADRTVTRPSFESFADGFFLTREDIAWFDAHYLRGGGHASDPRVSPLLHRDLFGQPPALVVTAGFDPLRDEGDAYAEALRAAGARVVHRRYPELIHAFVNLVGVSRVCREAVVEIAVAFRKLLDEGGGAPA